jgi:hypothetical protein
MTLAEQLTALTTARAALAAERETLNTRLNAIFDEDNALKAQEDAINAAMLAAVKVGIAEGKTFAAIGAELDGQG